MEPQRDEEAEREITYEELAKEAIAAGAPHGELTDDEIAYAREKAAGVNPYRDPTGKLGFSDYFSYVPPTREKFNLAVGHLLIATFILIPLPFVAFASASLQGALGLLPPIVLLLIVVGLPVRASRSRITIRGHRVTVHNPFRTYRYDTGQVTLVFRSFGNVGTAGWVPYGAPNGETLAVNAARPALLPSGKKNPIKIAAMRSRTESSVEVAELAAALR